MLRLHLAIAVLMMLSICLCEGAYARGKGGGGGGKGFGAGGKSVGGHGPKLSGPSAKSGGSKQLAKDHAPIKDKLAKEHDQPRQPKSDTDPLATNKKEKQLQLFQQQRDKKLAQADHLREIAERNGNANLAANADRMEAQALQQYADKAAHLEKFGVSDPLLNPEQPPVGDDLAGSLQP
jgi:delta 1-pyrroline-5-carboxylate dehydrogenase